MIMGAISDLQLPYPEGTTSQYAHQTFADPPAFGTSLQLNVDGFIATLDCKDAELHLHEASHSRGEYYFKINTTFEVKNEDCSMILKTDVGTQYPSNNSNTLNFVRMLRGSCSNLSTEIRNRTSIVIGRLAYTIDNPTESNQAELRTSGIKIIDSVQAICAPRYEIRKIGLVQNGTSVEVVNSTQVQSLKTIRAIKPWNFVSVQEDSFPGASATGDIPGGDIVLDDGSTVSLDQYTVLTRSSELSLVPDSELTDSALWLDAIPRYFQKLSAQIAYNSLLEPVSTTVIGNQTNSEDRLIVVKATCHAITALLVLCTLISIAIIFTLPRNISMHANPTTILGTVWMATEATSLLLRLGDQGLGKSREIQHRLDTAAYSLLQPKPNIFKLSADHSSSKIRPTCSNRPAKTRPHGKHTLVLHPVSRVLFSLSLCGGIIILESLLRLSQNNIGIGPSDLSQYLQYSWTLVPSVFFTTVALTAGSIDMAVRSLVPFLFLNKGGSIARTVDFDLLDGSVLRGLFKGIRVRAWPAAFALAASLVSSTFTVFSGSLYVNQFVPVKFGTTLQANTTFGFNGDAISLPVIDNAVRFVGGKGVVASSLILGHNGSFQPFTYKDLAFPSLVLDQSAFIGTHAYKASNSTAMTVVANVPAVRYRLQCRVYSREQIRTNLTLNYTATGERLDIFDSVETYRIPNPLRIDIDEEGCSVNDTSEYTASTIMIPTLREGLNEGETTFGVSSGGRYSLYNPAIGWIGGCSTILYTWGRVVVDPTGKFAVDVFALGCNETIETVETEVHFKSNALTIDSSQPPVPNEGSARPANFQLDQQAVPYGAMLAPPSKDSTQIFDTFFSFLTFSPWAIPIPDLANATEVDKVSAAIRAQHGLVRANHLDAFYREVPNSSVPGQTPSGFEYSGNVTLLPGRPRVVQDLSSTRVLQALLAVTLVLSLMAWCLMLRTNVIVGSPTNIARKIALAAGGNLFEEVLPPRGSAHLGTEGLINGKDRTFIMDWGLSRRSTGKKARFGIWALTAQEVEAMRARQAKESR
jgi:hypothetical protein